MAKGKKLKDMVFTSCPGEITGASIRSTTKVMTNGQPEDGFALHVKLRVGSFDDRDVHEDFDEWARTLVDVTIPERDEEESESAAGIDVSCRSKLPQMRWRMSTVESEIVDVNATCRLSPKVKIDGQGNRYVVLDLAMTVTGAVLVAIAKHMHADVLVDLGDMQLSLDLAPAGPGVQAN